MSFAKPRICQNCHIAEVVAKIELGSGRDAEVLWVCRSCTLELQKHDESLAATPAGGGLAAGEAHQQGEYKTDDLEKLFLAKMGRPINTKLPDLAAHYSQLTAAEGVDGEGNKWNCIDIEFNFVEYVTGISMDELKDCLLPQNQPKNRYANVVAPDPTRVKLSQIDGPTSDYINANWIAGRVPSSERRYIGAQGPLPNTVIDFWRMVYECNVSVIAMLTQEIENDRVKCEHYWPDGETPAMAYGQVTVRIVGADVTPEITTRTFDITHPNSPQPRRVTQFQYTAWPDFGQPSSCDAFLQMCSNVDEANHTGGPLLTHCSAGIGRTGTFIVVHSVLEEYRYYHQKKLPLTYNLIDVLRKLRAARPGMVQTKDQLTFCYRALTEAFDKYNAIHGPPAKPRSVTVKPLPPSDPPPPSVLAAASNIDIVPYEETEAAKRNNHDDSSDSDSESSSGGHRSRRSSRSGGRRRHGREKRSRRRTTSGRRQASSNGGNRSASSSSMSVLDRAIAEAKAAKGGLAGQADSVYLDV